TLEGIDGAQIFGHRLTALYDSRDNLLTPVKGTYASAYFELGHNLIHDQPDRWFRLAIDARHLIPHASGRMVFVGRVMIDKVFSQGIPFYERPTLGGENTLRGFGLNRFVDDNLYLVNLEERIRVYEKRIFDNPIEFEVALFVRHFSTDCSKADRAAQAVPAGEILEALRTGKGVSIRNGVVSGDLLLTRLPSVPLASVPLSPSVLATMAGSTVTEARVIRGPFVIRDSVFDGLLDTQLKPDMVEHRMLGDMVVIQGPVAFHGTTFTKNVDLSRTIFLAPVDSSEAVFLSNAFFLTSICDRVAISG